MNSGINTDIFYKVNKNNIIENDIFSSSSLFTSLTPNVLNANNISDYKIINDRLNKIYKNVVDQNFIKINENQNYQNYQNYQKGGNINLTTETMNLPINYSDSTNTVTSYIYKDEIELKKNN